MTRRSFGTVIAAGFLSLFGVKSAQADPAVVPMTPEMLDLLAEEVALLYASTPNGNSKMELLFSLRQSNRLLYERVMAKLLKHQISLRVKLMQGGQITTTEARSVLNALQISGTA